MSKIPKKLRIGVVGIGIRGQHSYEQILKKDSRVEIVACSHYPNASKVLEEGADENFRREYAKKLGAEYYDDYRQLLEREDIELISLMCEPSRALELGRECFDAGKDVLRDKPMTKTAEQARGLIDCAKSKTKLLLVALPLRFHSVLNEVKRDISAGRIGEIISATMAYIWTNGPLEGFTASKDYIEAYGGGDVNNAGFHAIDYLNWIIDSKPISVYCRQNSFFYDDYKKIGMEDFGAITITYESGAIANLITGRIPAKQKPIGWVDISGTKGSIDVRNFRATIRVNSEAEFCDNTPLDMIGKAIVDVALEKRTTDLTRGEDALQVSLILEAARESAISGSEVKIDA